MHPTATPPRPADTATLHEFGRALYDLRAWSGLTQQSFKGTHRAMSDSTISRYENGAALPTLEWVHAYVERCLRRRNPDMTPEESNAEFDPWRTAWTRLEHADTPQVPADQARDPEPPPHHPETSQPAAPVPPASAATGEPTGRRRVRLPRRRAVLVGGAVVAAGAIAAAATGVFDATPTTPTPPVPLSGSTVPVALIHASGQVQNLRGVEGIDLDTNNRADQDAPGVDISFAATSTHLNAMANRVTFTVLPEAGAEERQRCVTAVDWMRQIPNIYDLTEGRNICVITDEGRFSMLTITKRASAATGTIDLRYTTWN